VPIHRQNTSLLPINKIWAFSWGGMILRETLTLPRSNGHQHEQNNEDYAQPLHLVKNATPAERLINANVIDLIELIDK
ncbi:hypothetical protein ACQ9E5_08505, partial [Klebsiella quasipneumoniae]|uniref:hypothetical protein n=1 Tax=Klebsiella quasipneumoniae TaxID=1463165 RepID=UPI003D3699CD